MLKYEDDFKVAMTRRHKRLPIICLNYTFELRTKLFTLASIID